MPPLNESNYPQWKYRMLVLLEDDEGGCRRAGGERGRYSAIQETKTKLAEKRMKRERRCKSLLISRISDMLAYIQDKQTPRAIWLTLEKVLEWKSIADRLYLQKKLLTLRYDGGSLQYDFLTFERFIREYESTSAELSIADEVSRVINSGSFEHLTNNRELFEKLVPMKSPMHISIAKEGEFIVA